MTASTTPNTTHFSITLPPNVMTAAHRNAGSLEMQAQKCLTCPPNDKITETMDKQTNKAYAAFYGVYSDRKLIGIFSTREAARTALEAQNVKYKAQPGEMRPEIEEVDIDVSREYTVYDSCWPSEEV